MKKFIKDNKKIIKICLIGLVFLFILLMVWLFIVPSFNGNKYGDRLKDNNKHKLSNEAISKIKDKAKENDSVIKINYRKDGRVLNFTITVDSNFGVNQAKEFASSLLGEIGEDNLKYYDVQFFIASDEEKDEYPIIGYKSKKSDSISFGNAGGNGE